MFAVHYNSLIRPFEGNFIWVTFNCLFSARIDAFSKRLPHVIINLPLCSWRLNIMTSQTKAKHFCSFSERGSRLVSGFKPLVGGGWGRSNFSGIQCLVWGGSNVNEIQCLVWGGSNVRSNIWWSVFLDRVILLLWFWRELWCDVMWWCDEIDQNCDTFVSNHLEQKYNLK